MAKADIDFLLPDEFYSPEELKSALENISFYERKIAGGFKPCSPESVQAIVKWANLNKIKLYPFSKGNNWALGSKLPVHDNNFLLDLSRLNTIHEYNNEFGFVRIGTGVTQGQLCDFLEKKKNNFFLDVTGAGKGTSIIGNALERGIAYNSLRSDYILNLEVLLGNGEKINTGFGSRIDGLTSDVYAYGLGPHLDQIFFQSNFGIVLSATYQLIPKPPDRAAIQIEFKENDMASVLQKTKNLLQRGTLDCIVHFADPYRSISTLIPLVDKMDKDYYYQQAMKKKLWTGIASVYGSKQVVAAKLADLKKEFGSLCRVRSYNEKTVLTVQKLSSLFGFRRFAKFLEATKGLRNLVSGSATDDALSMVDFNPDDFLDQEKLASDENMDRGARGLLFCVPIAAFNSAHCQKMVEIIRASELKYKKINFGITLNTLNEKVVEAVISLHFEKSIKAIAHAALIEIYNELIRNGFPPYRLNPQIMDILPIKNPAHLKLLADFKLACDPNGVLAPGRYC